jgi:thiosulfate/3-mercaptopyruvate sulfurtransferase
MWAQLRIRLVLGLALFAFLPSNATGQEWSEAQREVWNTVQDLWALSSALDLDAWFEKVSDEYRGWSVADETTRDKAIWREQAEGRFSAPRRAHYQLVPRAVDVHGDVAIAFYHYSAVTRSREGALSTSRGQWTDWFRREDGEWKLLGDAGGETHSDPEILVSARWLAERLDGSELAIIQVERQGTHYAEGHIPGARYLPYSTITWEGEHGEGSELLPFDELEATLENLGISDEDHVVVYGSHPLIQARLWLTLDILGVGSRVSLLDGGLPAWIEEGNPLSQDPQEPRPRGDLTLRPRSNVVVDAEWILGQLDDPSLALVDARYAEEYTGEGQEGAAVGHLPGAGSAPWVDLVASREVFRLQPLGELASSFLDAGADPGETVVPYCIIGLRASLDYFVARLLGFETRFYDGSWRDWTSRGHPLVEGGRPR